MTPKELVETALHVLVAWNSGSNPDPGEVEVLVGPCADRTQLLVQTLRLQAAAGAVIR